jgi:hypothetical protein
MDSTQMLGLIVGSQLAATEARSALPNAPVVADAARPQRARLYRTRFATATVLQRAAARIVPA